MGEWTWMNGPSMANQAAVYGTQSVFATANRPPCSYEACQWTDNQGYFWLFGGTGSYNDDLWKFDPSLNQWAWIKGPGVGNQPGVYGTFQVPSAANNPGGRGYGEITWTDNFNNLWMYGGYGKDVNNFQGFLGDLWEYNITTNEWTWMSGSDTISTVPIYGTMGVPDPANTPGARNECNAAWVDDNNNLWLYGGDLNLNSDRAGDLWMYNTAINEWVWMNGTTAVNATPVWGTKGIPNSANMPGGRFCYTSWKSCDGDFWMFGGSDYNDMWRYNIASNMWTWMSGTSTIGAAGISNGTCIPDTGNIPEGKTENRTCWTLNGNNFVNYGGNFFSDLWNFNAVTLEWTLMNGEPNTSANPNFGTILVSSPTNTPGDRGGALGFKDNDGNLWLFGGFGFTGDYNDMWKFVLDTTCPVITICDSKATNVTESSSNKPQVSVYPNPNDGTFTIENLHPGGIGVIYDLQITDLSGRIIFSYHNITNNKETFTLPLSNGIYFLNIITGSKTYNGKLFINNSER